MAILGDRSSHRNQHGRSELHRHCGMSNHLVTRTRCPHDVYIQNPGDLWYFPAGMPHSLQATNDTEDGAEFVIVSGADYHHTANEWN